PGVLPGPPRLIEAAWPRRPLPSERGRVLTGGGPSVRSNRGTHRRHTGQAAGRERIRTRAHLDLRRRRPGRRRHPRSRMKLRVPGVPAATPLRRYSPDQPLVDRPVLTGSAPGARIDLRWIPLAVTSHSPLAGEGPGDGSGPWSAIIFDATGISDVAGLSELHAFTAPAFRNLRPCGRLIVLGTPPEDCTDPAAAAAQRALDGLIRSAGKEARSGSTAHLIDGG